MSSVFGNRLKISVFGQSHGEAIGVIIDGFPAGFKIDFEKLRNFMNRRAPGNASFSTARKESDAPRFISGLLSGITCGAPLCAVIPNENTKSEDYGELLNRPRPGHADYTADVKYNGYQDFRGGGHFSGRLTAPLCVAGALCLQFLESKDIHIAAHISSVGTVEDYRIEKWSDKIAAVSGKKFPVINDAAGERMIKEIENARAHGDSVGGVIECGAFGVPAGLGDPMFDGVENRISAAVFAVPAVKGIEFGSGFAGAGLKGSENNDSFVFENGKVITKTNNHGGILGGITSGMPVIFRVAVKPTPSIAVEQQTVNLTTGANEKIIVRGRHDPCIVPRAVPVIEAVCAMVLCDYML